jgi:hypothetical protein
MHTVSRSRELASNPPHPEPVFEAEHVCRRSRCRASSTFTTEFQRPAQRARPEPEKVFENEHFLKGKQE